MTYRILSRLLGRWASARRDGRRHPDLGRRSRSRPRVEALECRCLPSTVTNLDDAGDGSLRQVILDTPTGGVVDFQPGLTGTITLATGELVIDKDLTIAGPGADVLTVSGNAASQVFDVPGPFTVAIAGLTIDRGQAPRIQVGGGIVNFGTLTVTDSTISRSVHNFNSLACGIANFGTLTVNRSIVSDNSDAGIYNLGRLDVADSTFSGNGGEGIRNYGALTLTGSTVSDTSGVGIDNLGGTAAVISSTLSGNFAFNFDLGAGGGIFNNSGTLLVVGSTISGNFGATGGGGIFNTSGTVTVFNSTLSGNRAISGGGIDNVMRGTVTVINSTLADNSAAARGGGIFNDTGGRLSITNSTLSGNSVVIGGGGGIDNEASSAADVASSTLSGNVSGGDGGGILNAGTLTVNSSTLSGNTANNGGGITNGGSATATYSTISSNVAATTGGGIEQTGSGQTTARNMLLAGNTAPSSPDVYNRLNSQGHNLIGDGSGGSGYIDTDLVGSADNPIDPLLGSLQDNGGSTLTMALLPGSPARAAGDNRDLRPPPWDQRGPGYPRWVNNSVDIGAYEVQPGEDPAAPRRPQAQAPAAQLAVALPRNAPAVFPPVVVATPPFSTPVSTWPVADSVTGDRFQAAPWTRPAKVARQARDVVFAELGSATGDVLSVDG